MLYITAKKDTIFISIGYPLSRYFTLPVIHEGEEYEIVEVTPSGAKKIGKFKCRKNGKTIECGPLKVTKKGKWQIFEYRGHYYAENPDRGQIYTDDPRRFETEKSKITEYDSYIANYEGRRYANSIPTSIIRTTFKDCTMRISVDGRRVADLPLTKEKTKVLEKHFISDNILYMKLKINGEKIELYIDTDENDIEIVNENFNYDGSYEAAAAVLKIIEEGGINFAKSML